MSANLSTFPSKRHLRVPFLPLLFAGSATSLAGCGAMQENVAHAVAAPPLELDATFGGNVGSYCGAVAKGWQVGGKPPASPAIASPTTACVQSVIHDSLTKCQGFINRVVGDQIGWDTGLDIAGLAGSTIGAVVAPASVARGFSAASSIFTGSRTAIDTDIYAKAARGNFSKAIQASYYKQMIALRDDMTKNPSNYTAPAAAESAIDSVVTNHAACTLDAAEAAITATVSSAATPGTGGTGSTAAVPVTTAPAGGTAARRAQLAPSVPVNSAVACAYHDTPPGAAITPPCGGK